MEWSEEAIVLSARLHGETSAIAEVFTREHGRHLGLVHGGRSRRMRPVLQPGNLVACTWRARLSEHLGAMRVELIKPHAVNVFHDRLALMALGWICVLTRLLPERDPHPALHGPLCDLVAALERPDDWPTLLVRWELLMLGEMGFGLDLNACAATGRTEGLAFVSPRSGRAVSAEAGAPYAQRLLALPAFLVDHAQPAAPADIVAGLELTGYFLEHHGFGPQGQAMPPARAQLMRMLRRASEPVRSDGAG
jgi:DNA repair protein RecO (recombination protein O)